MNRELSKTLKLESDFRKAIRHGELRLFYQPRIDIANNTLIGMESLVRWQHPELGLLTPDQFIPMAERTGMIVPMGYLGDRSGPVGMSAGFRSSVTRI